MAKTGVLETDPTMAAKTIELELKKELLRLVTVIILEDDYSAETTDQTFKTFYALKDLKFKPLGSFGLHNHAIPDEFRCPISGELMTDPVVLSTGQTYDRQSIQKWLKEGHQTCPQTQKVLSHGVPFPNHLVRELIARWCEEHKIELPEPVHNTDEEMIIDADRTLFNSLLQKMSSSLPDQKEAAKVLQQLTKWSPSFRALFGESTDSITQLLNPNVLLIGRGGADPELQEDVMTIVVNVLGRDSNKKLVAEIEHIPLVIYCLESGTIKTRSDAAAALLIISSLEFNMFIIGMHGGIKPLIDLLEEGHPLAMQDVISAIYNLCTVLENKDSAVRDGLVGVILKKIVNRTLVDELLPILSMLCSHGHEMAVEEMEKLGAVPCLLSVMRGSTCEKNKEYCVGIVHTICVDGDRTKLREIREEEDASGTISRLAQSGTWRAKENANGILKMLK